VRKNASFYAYFMLALRACYGGILHGHVLVLGNRLRGLATLTIPELFQTRLLWWVRFHAADKLALTGGVVGKDTLW
jgi:hypothetical protein